MFAMCLSYSRKQDYTKMISDFLASTVCFRVSHDTDQTMADALKGSVRDAKVLLIADDALQLSSFIKLNYPDISPILTTT